MLLFPWLLFCCLQADVELRQALSQLADAQAQVSQLQAQMQPQVQQLAELRVVQEEKTAEVRLAYVPAEVAQQNAFCNDNAKVARILTAAVNWGICCVEQLSNSHGQVL
jgi:hypothetical protein